jgi:subtilisin family serine protease
MARFSTNKTLFYCTCLLVLRFWTAPAQAGAGYNVIVQIEPGANIHQVVAGLQGTLLETITTNTYLISIPAWPSSLPAGVIAIEPDGAVSLPAFQGGVIVAGQTADWYKSQPAMQKVNLSGALARATGRGIVIADINAAVDAGHPALRGRLTTGYDFVGNGNKPCASQPNQSTASFLDQSTASFLDQSTASFLDPMTTSFLQQSSASFLEQSTASFLDQNSPAHGHGTMVAGVLAVMAPDALIMPLRAFDDSGCADASRIAKAIRHAVANGAQVINMSFGVSGNSAVMKAALDQAAKANVLLIASAGNSNSSSAQAPAAFSNVIGVAATDLQDRKAPFSNYGPNASLNAPGVNVISAFPGGYYAVLSGTSFAAPMAASLAGLIRSINASAAQSSVAAGAVNIDPLNPQYAGQLGSGRIDMLGALTR